MKTSEPLKVLINWENMSSLKVDGAIYPEELNGLPLLSIPLTEPGIENISIRQMETVEFHGDFPLTVSFDTISIISSKKMVDRGKEITFLEIIPILYDTLNTQYKLITAIEIELHKATKKPKKSSHLRTSADINNSVLSTGNWYKIPIIKEGVHQIDYKYLEDAGINMTGFNPKNIKIFGNGGGMLPQLNSAERPDDLMENAIYVDGESDGKFDNSDFILFYAQGADHHKLLENGTLEYEKNFYSDTSFYFLTIAEEEGLRIAEKENLGLDHPKITSFDDYLIYEKEEYNIINSGRSWFGEKFDFTTTYDFNFEFADLVANTNLSVTSGIMGQTYKEASLDLFINSETLGQQTIYTIQEGSYLAKGSLQTETFEKNTNDFPNLENLVLRLTFHPAGSGTSRAFLDYLIIQGKRKLKLFGNQTHFRSIESTQNALSTFTIDNSNSVFQIWDVTNPLLPTSQKFSTTENQVSFGALTGDLSEYIVFNDEFLIPEKPQKIENQNLHATKDIDLLIISYPDFIEQAERLADLRKSHDGLRVKVVSPPQIYHEFSSGKLDVTAIRDFIKLVYDKGDSENRLQNVLLFGKGSFDYKDRIERNTNYVPIYTSRNSLHPINSYSSDDYYGFMDEDEGEWIESMNGDQLMDIGVGRLPVKSREEAKIVVDKLIRYATEKKTFGNWRNEVFFIADDGDGNLHQRDADKLATLVDTSYTQFNTNKIYIDAYEQIETSIGEAAPEVNEEIDRSIHKGGLIFNFTGHGSPTRWTSETIFNISSIIELENENVLPLFVTATCEFGRHDNPKAISGAEYLLINPHGGAIGLLTTARPVYSSTNYILNQAFYEQVFEKEENKYMSLGEVFRKTKNRSLNGTVNRNFSLLADPSMTLAYGKEEIRIIADENAYQPGDTLKALDKVKIRGEVLGDDGKVNTSFNGKLISTVFDKPREIETLGQENPKMTFIVRDNIVFRGEVSVNQGEFSVEFVVPKNIDYNFALGKISMYAFDELNFQDASGSNIDFVVGGESDDPVEDNTPPEIELFINDTSFVAGGITGPDILLVGKLMDESGISTTISENGESLTIILDDSISVYANKYYVAENDTYKIGWVTYPFKELSMGTHKIRLQAWDVHNNFNEAEITFSVIDGDEIKIKNLINYPNPFRDYTRFAFEHNRAGDDLEIMIQIYSTTGKLIKQVDYIEENSPARISNIAWDKLKQNGSNILEGVYIFRLSVRSLKDGSKSFANHKFVIIN